MSQNNNSSPQSLPGARSSAPRSPSDVGPLVDQIRELYGRTAYSHKTHIIQAGLELDRQWRIKVVEIALAAITTTGLITTSLGSTQIGLVVGTVASSFLLGIILYTKDFDLGSISEQHKRTADELWNVREQYLSLLTDIAAGVIAPEAIVKKRDALQLSLDTIYSTARVTSAKAYGAAQNALKNNEDLTFADKELDLMLPTKLRKTPSAEDASSAEPRIRIP